MTNQGKTVKSIYMTNTKKSGLARIIIFPEKKQFVAVCLDFDLIEEAKTREEAEEQIKEAVVGYIQNVCKNNMEDKLLNRHAPKKYWKMYEEYLKLIKTNKGRASFSKNTQKSSLFTLPINELVGCGV